MVVWARSLNVKVSLRVAILKRFSSVLFEFSTFLRFVEFMCVVVLLFILSFACPPLQLSVFPFIAFRCTASMVYCVIQWSPIHHSLCVKSLYNDGIALFYMAIGKLIRFSYSFILLCVSSVVCLHHCCDLMVFSLLVLELC